MTEPERAIHDLHATWIAAVNAGDLDRLLALMNDDAVFLTPGQLPSRRDDFAANFASAHERLRVRCTSELEEVVAVGGVAYTRSRDGLSVVPRAGGEPTQLAGYRMTVYREQPDGRWLLARDIHTLVPVGT